MRQFMSHPPIEERIEALRRNYSYIRKGGGW
jgi:Zn-dependent protease with chaperone function